MPIEQLLVDGQLNRAALRQIIFKNPEQKSWLEKLLHPLIGEWIAMQLEQPTSSPYIILESPLLFETDPHTSVLISLCWWIFPLNNKKTEQVNRDDVTLDQIQAIINTQMSRERKISLADYIFDNSLAIETIDKRVLELHSNLKT